MSQSTEGNWQDDHAADAADADGAAEQQQTEQVDDAQETAVDAHVAGDEGDAPAETSAETGE